MQDCAFRGTFEFMETLRDIRRQMGMTQEQVAVKVAQVTGNRLSSDRRHIMIAESQGTDNVLLIEGLAAVYSVASHRLYAANRRQLEASGKIVQ